MGLFSSDNGDTEDDDDEGGFISNVKNKASELALEGKANKILKNDDELSYEDLKKNGFESVEEYIIENTPHSSIEEYKRSQWYGEKDCFLHIKKPDGKFTDKPLLRIPDRNSLTRVEKETLETMTSIRKDSITEEREERYEVDILEFCVSDDAVYIKASEGKYGEQEFQRNYSQIQSANFNTSGYRCEMSMYFDNKIHRISFPNEILSDEGGREVVDYIRERLDRRDSTSNLEGSSTDSEEEDNISKIKRLAELRDDGIITEEEFESKKSELLNGI